MPSWLEGRPFALVFLALYVIGTARGQLTYGLARWATTLTVKHTHKAHGWKARLNGWLDGERVARGRRSLERWGLPVITLSYLTVGFQTLVLAAAGAMRMSWLRFSLAQAPGVVVWALIYSTIGFAAWGAAVNSASHSPWFLVGALVALVAGLSWWVTRSLRRTGRNSTQQE